MPHPLFVTDLDGTLLQADGRLSVFARERLAAFTAQGVPVTVASGRMFSSIRRALGEARLQLPIISSDGALISTFDSPSPLHVFGMEELVLQDLVAYLSSEGYSPLLDVWDGRENYMVSEAPTNPAMAWFHDHKTEEEHYRWRHQADLSRPRGARTISLTLVDRPEWLEPLREDLDDRFGEWFKTDYLVFREWNDGAALWVQHRDARKEKALEVLSAMLGYTGNEVVVFGDELNDLGMFGREWHAVAVENARAELKDRAHEVIGPHSDDSVVKYIERRVGA